MVSWYATNATSAPLTSRMLKMRRGAASLVPVRRTVTLPVQRNDTYSLVRQNSVAVCRRICQRFTFLIARDRTWRFSRIQYRKQHSSPPQHPQGQRPTAWWGAVLPVERGDYSYLYFVQSILFVAFLRSLRAFAVAAVKIIVLRSFRNAAITGLPVI